MTRKNTVTDNLVKIELDMDKTSRKAFAQFHDKICFIYEHNSCRKMRREIWLPFRIKIKLVFILIISLFVKIASYNLYFVFPDHIRTVGATLIKSKQLSKTHFS